MEGGIKAWQGLTADGPPEAGIAWFAVGTTAADMAALAWALEENTRLFYTALAGMRPGTDEADLFLSLVEAEEYHKKTLETVHNRLTDEAVDRFYRKQSVRILEGGIEMDEALKWAEGKPARRVLNLAIGLEANAYDRYLKMMEKAADEDSRDVFETVAREEKGHLKGLAGLLDEVIGLE
jgi:rubrerythrin